MEDISLDIRLQSLYSAISYRYEDHDLIWVIGDDALSYLQGQITQDLVKQTPWEDRQAFALEPKGHVDALLSVKKINDKCFLLGVDAGFGPELLERLKRFKIRIKADLIEDKGSRLYLFNLDDTHKLQTVSGLYQDYILFYLSKILHRSKYHFDLETVPDRPSQMSANKLWSGARVYEILIPNSGASIDIEDGMRLAIDSFVNEFAIIDKETFDLARICYGIPKMGYEITDKVLPASLGINDKTVDYAKGCYTGQELVARLDARGNNVPFALTTVVIEKFYTDRLEKDQKSFIDDESIENVRRNMDAGEIKKDYRIFSNDKEIGRITSLSASKITPGLQLALAFVKRDIKPGESVDIIFQSAGSTAPPILYGQGILSQIPVVNCFGAELKEIPS
jgi:folate-binding protein YgfZ